MAPAHPPAPGARMRYEVRVRCVLSPAALCYLRSTDATTIVERHTLVRFSASSDLDVSEIFSLLSANDVDTVSIRRL